MAGLERSTSTEDFEHFSAMIGHPLMVLLQDGALGVQVVGRVQSVSSPSHIPGVVEVTIERDRELEDRHF